MAKIKDSSKFVRLDRELVGEISNFLFALGNQFASVNNAGGAFDCFRYSVELNPLNQPAVNNMGVLYNLTGNYEGAYRMFKEASRMVSTDIKAKIYQAEMARKLGKLEESRNLLQIVYGLCPDDLEVLSSLSMLEYDLGNLNEALRLNDLVLEKVPSHPKAMLNRALINMLNGQWAENWASYEYCLSYSNNTRMKGKKMSEAWAGQEHPGGTLMVVSDQGSGDAIQMSRYLKEAKTLGKFGKLVFAGQPDLEPLLARVDGIDEFMPFGASPGMEVQAFSSLLGIMRVLQVTPDNCWREPHILSDPKLDEVWSARIPRDPRFRGHVGVCWAGDPKHGNDHARSFSAEHFMRLRDQFPDLRFYSFQVGSAVKQLSADQRSINPIVDLGQHFRSFDDTASALKQMDLLISCDTSIAHLAGSTGIPAVVLLPNPPEWRWLTSGITSVWYDNVRLIRQDSPRDWVGSFQKLVDVMAEAFWSFDFAKCGGVK